MVAVRTSWEARTHRTPVLHHTGLHSKLTSWLPPCSWTLIHGLNQLPSVSHNRPNSRGDYREMEGGGSSEEWWDGLHLAASCLPAKNPALIYGSICSAGDTSVVGKRKRGKAAGIF